MDNINIEGFNKKISVSNMYVVLHPSEVKKTLNSFKEIDDFFIHEEKFWTDIPTHSAGSDKNFYDFRNLITSNTKEYSKIKENLLNINLQDEKQVDLLLSSLKGFIEAYNKKKEYLYSQSPEAQIIRENTTRNSLFADGFFAYYINKGFLISGKMDKTFMEGYLQALVIFKQKKIFTSYSKQTKRFYEKELLEIADSLSTLKKKHESEFERINDSNTAKLDEIEKFHSKSLNELNIIQSEIKEKLAEIEKTYADKLRLDEPAEHWRKHSRWNQLKSIVWFFIAAVLIFIISCVVIKVYKNEFPIHAFYVNSGNLDYRTTSSDIIRLYTSAENIKGTIFVALIISLLIYLLRLTVRLGLSAQHLAYDASERARLTYFYLSLKNNTNIEEQQKLIILQSLFSRSDTGLFKEDHAPTLPEGIIATINDLSKRGIR